MRAAATFVLGPGIGRLKYGGPRDAYKKFPLDGLVIVLMYLHEIEQLIATDTAPYINKEELAAAVHQLIMRTHRFDDEGREFQRSAHAVAHVLCEYLQIEAYGNKVEIEGQLKLLADKEENTEDYKEKKAALQQSLADAKTKVAQATEEAADWKSEYDKEKQTVGNVLEMMRLHSDMQRKISATIAAYITNPTIPPQQFLQQMAGPFQVQNGE